MYNSVVKVILYVMYGAKTWEFNKHLELKCMSIQIDFLRRSVSCPKLKKTLEIMKR